MSQIDKVIEKVGSAINAVLNWVESVDYRWWVIGAILAAGVVIGGIIF